MNGNRMIFHIPMQIDRNRSSASQIRPLKMIEAFASIGYIVDVVEGYGKDRKVLIDKIKDKIKNGVKYDFLYSESSTMPTLLTEKNHFPTYPYLDFDFFSYCKDNNIKIGLFYRDIYWVFNKNLNIKNVISRFFYKYDLRKYESLIDVLFLPSLDMCKYIPLKKHDMKIIELPSGCNIESRENSSKNGIHLLYIGGIEAHYNLTLILKVLVKHPNIHFTICCRPDEWARVKDSYNDFLTSAITIVHKTKNELNNLYKEHNLFCIFMEPSEYWNFAVPYKLFEAIGYCKPILSNSETWVGKFIEKNRLGYTTKYDEISLDNLLTQIEQNKTEFIDIQSTIYEIAKQNTWESRCLTVANFL